MTNNRVISYKDLVTRALSLWNFSRNETLEILESLDDEKLLFTPKGEKWQPLYFQFNCVGMTQLVYTRAIREGKMDYAWFHEGEIKNRLKYKTKKELKDFLNKANSDFIKEVRKRRNDQSF